MTLGKWCPLGKSVLLEIVHTRPLSVVNPIDKGMESWTCKLQLLELWHESANAMKWELMSDATTCQHHGAAQGLQVIVVDKKILLFYV